MSKLSQLKQDAYQAGKGRDWDKAISVYEQILEIEKKNPSLVNELGDICLKAGENSRAIRHFLNAAALYRKNGLVNNAVAIHKKILRYDDKNMSAHWYLAESRAAQGLKHEGQEHVMAFLGGSGELAGDLQEIYFSRCVTLLELYHDNLEILEKLIQVFRMWEKPLETARAEVLHCCVRHLQDDPQAAADVESILVREPAIANYPEFSRWRQIIDPQAGDRPGAFDDFGAVDLDGPATLPDTPLLDETASDLEALPPQGADASMPAEKKVAETSFAGLNDDDDYPTPAADETSFGDLKADLAAANPGSGAKRPNIDPLALEKDDDGCISIDCDGPGDLDDILSEAIGTSEAPRSPEQECSASTDGVAGDQQVNLLEQILAEDDGDLLGLESNQLETITAEIGSQVGGDGDGADQQYEMGLVYLEMGMLEPSFECFQAASQDRKIASRAFEMWSLALERAHRPDEAMAVLRLGVDAETMDDSGRLGLLYHLGKMLEKENLLDEAGACYDRILAQDQAYMDVQDRRAKLPVTT